MPKTEKQKAWKWCSKYIRLRDATEFSRKYLPPDEDPVCGECCSCGKIVHWKYADAGHYFGRGMGGGSGVYFDERNIHLQCKQCNAGFKGDVAQAYTDFMLKKYGQKVIDELRLKHHVPLRQRDGEFRAIGQYYKERYEELKNGKKKAAS